MKRRNFREEKKSECASPTSFQEFIDRRRKSILQVATNGKQCLILGNIKLKMATNKDRTTRSSVVLSNQSKLQKEKSDEPSKIIFLLNFRTPRR
jgi:hypothetical protein